MVNRSAPVARNFWTGLTKAAIYRSLIMNRVPGSMMRVNGKIFFQKLIPALWRGLTLV